MTKKTKRKIQKAVSWTFVCSFWGLIVGYWFYTLFTDPAEALKQSILLGVIIAFSVVYDMAARKIQ